MEASTVALVGGGFLLGLMHALDADHIMAVSALSSSRPRFSRTLRFCLQWALGHGGVLLACGLLLFGLGVHLPDDLVRVAELAVGVLLMGIGVFYLWRFRNQSVRLETHRHGDIVHTHWQVGSEPAGVAHKDGHAPLMVGMLHGLAGSAPALALVPVLAGGELAPALAYLVIFSLGVAASMVCFGATLGTVQQRLHGMGQRWLDRYRQLTAASPIVLGGYWLHQAL